jgi:hypothetical protein
MWPHRRLLSGSGTRLRAPAARTAS